MAWNTFPASLKEVHLVQFFIRIIFTGMAMAIFKRSHRRMKTTSLTSIQC